MSSDRPGGPADVVPGDGPARRRTGRPPPSGRGPSRRSAASAGQAKKGSLLRELPVLLLIAFVLALVVKTFFVQAFFIPSGSMEQTLHGCTGLHRRPRAGQQGPVLVRRARARRRSSSSRARTPGRRRSTVAEPSNWFTGALLWLGRTVGVAPPSEDDFVKRVIATEGQTVAVLRRRGAGDRRRQAARRALHLREHPDRAAAPFGPVTVPEGRLWVMGDHRSASADSARAHRRPVQRHHRRRRRHRQGRADRLAGEPLRAADSPDIQGTEAARRWPCAASAGAARRSAWRRRRAAWWRGAAGGARPGRPTVRRVRPRLMGRSAVRCCYAWDSRVTAIAARRDSNRRNCSEKCSSNRFTLPMETLQVHRSRNGVSCVCTYGEHRPRGHPRAPPRRRARPASRSGQHDQRDGRHAVGGYARRTAPRPHAGRVGPPRRRRRGAGLRPRRDPERLPRPAAPLPPDRDRRAGHVRGPGRRERGDRRRHPRLPHDQHLADAARLGDPGRPRRPHRRRPADPPGRAVGRAGRQALHAGGAADPARVRRAGRAAPGPVQPADRPQPVHQRGHREVPRQGHPAQAGCPRPGPRGLPGALQPAARLHLRAQPVGRPAAELDQPS